MLLSFFHPKIPVREFNTITIMIINSNHDIGQIIRKVRKQLNITQGDLALTAGTGLRFISELEQGKPTCQIGKILQVLQVLGIRCQLTHTEITDDEKYS